MDYRRTNPAEITILDERSRPQYEASTAIQRQCQLIFKEARQKDNLKTFQKIKYQGHIHRIGQFLEVFSLYPKNHYVVKLLTIGGIQTFNKQTKKTSINRLFIQVEWYSKKNDICQKKFEKILKDISNNQLFASGQKFVLPVQSIAQKCQVLNWKDYSQIGMVQNSIYYNRFSYNKETKVLTPDPSQIIKQKQYCKCHRLYNPDLEYVMCEKCEIWFHNQCVFESLAHDEDFVCDKCNPKTKNLKKKR